MKRKITHHEYTQENMMHANTGTAPRVAYLVPLHTFTPKTAVLGHSRRELRCVFAFKLSTPKAEHTVSMLTNALLLNISK